MFYKMGPFISLTWLPVPSATSHPSKGKPQEIIVSAVILVLCATLPSCPSGCLPDLFAHYPQKTLSLSGLSRISLKHLQPPKPLQAFLDSSPPGCPFRVFSLLPRPISLAARLKSIPFIFPIILSLAPSRGRAQPSLLHKNELSHPVLQFSNSSGVFWMKRRLLYLSDTIRIYVPVNQLLAGVKICMHKEIIFILSLSVF